MIIQVEQISDLKDKKMITHVTVIIDWDEKMPHRTDDLRKVLYHAAVHLPADIGRIDIVRLPKAKGEDK